jgi:rare lipoprotein A
MNFRIWSGLTAATLLMTTLGIAPLSKANPVTPIEAEPAVNLPVGAPVEAISQALPNSPNPSSVVSPSAEAVSTEGTKVGQVASPPSDVPTPTEVPAGTVPAGTVATTPAPAAAAEPQTEAMKVGEYQSNEQAEESLAVIQSYESEGRQVATLYVRNIPVFSFLGGEAIAPAANPEMKLPSPTNAAATEVSIVQRKPEAAAAAPNGAAARATAIAAQVNQLHRNSVDASTIRAVWDEPKQRYLIKVGEDTLTAIDPDTILADTTNDPQQDALQAANRLRRLLGNAEPLTEVEGAPRPATQISLGPVQLTVSGYASWYGPGFNGNLSASGEVFNENAMTAAHPNLPFGTQVRVTNMDNGLSVVVRINDRGPYAGDRIIDLSAGAADVIGLTNAGVAPVRLDVLGAAN